MESRALAYLMTIKLKRCRRTLHQRRQPGLAVHDGQSHQNFAVEEQEVE